ncbi:MAG: glucose-6-phosphate dehydrogenase assembly protein OpcA, partial [Solirubrobacteraceae bacterium]
MSDEPEPWEDAWSDRDTTPSTIEAALREMLATRHHESHAFVPARVLNLVVIAEREYKGEIENRLQRVGRYHPSRLVICAVSDGRTTVDASVHIGTSQFAGPGHIAVGRERIGLDIGPKHLQALDTIVDPLLVPDLATVVWAPHRHAEGVDALRRLAQIVLLDSQDEPTVGGGFARSVDLAANAYVVDLAWLRSTPWRERIAAAFDPPAERARLDSIASVTVRHREDSLAAAVLFCGWLSSRLGWKPESLALASGELTG